MRKTQRAIRRLLPLAAAVLLAAPASASAHALFGSDDPDRPVVEYLTLGFAHMVTGWDHLLFIAGVVLLAGSLMTAAKLISLFVAGHSLTLLAATLAEWRLDATAVDVVIALSLVYVAVQGFRGRPESLRIFGTVVFAFGLIHGLGLSTRLQDLGLPDGGLVGRVLLFNVGVEIGQLVALAVIVGVGTLLARDIGDRAEEIRRYCFFAIGVAGVIGVAIISLPGSGGEAEKIGASCTSQEAQAPQVLAGGHPEKQFFGPGERAPEEDLGHVIGDGFLVVRYRPDLGVRELAVLKALVGARDSNRYVVAAPDPAQDEPLRAVTATRTLSCSEVDLEGLMVFRDEWFERLREQRSQP